VHILLYNKLLLHNCTWTTWYPECNTGNLINFTKYYNNLISTTSLPGLSVEDLFLQLNFAQQFALCSLLLSGLGRLIFAYFPGMLEFPVVPRGITETLKIRCQEFIHLAHC
jgi:hypothetical protein